MRKIMTVFVALVFVLSIGAVLPQQAQAQKTPSDWYLVQQAESLKQSASGIAQQLKHNIVGKSTRWIASMKSNIDSISTQVNRLYQAAKSPQTRAAIQGVLNAVNTLKRISGR